MSTLLPIACDTNWTLVYDASVDGSFNGGVQSSGLGVMRVANSLPVELSGFETHSVPTPIQLSGSDKLYVRAYLGSINILLG